MLLVIDIGNTNIVFAAYDGKDQKGCWRCETKPILSAKEYQDFLRDKISPSDVHDVIVSSVVPDCDAPIRQMSIDIFAVQPIFIGVDTGNLGIEIKIDRPSELGADRLVNAFAVHKEYGYAAIVVDFGTATTFDVVDAHGNFCGGVIAPGPNVSLEALYLAAAKLPSVTVQKPKAALAKNTIDAMRSGVFWGYVGLVEKILERLIHEWGEKPKIIATGGLARLFRDDIPAIDVIDEDLTLKGLLAIYQQVKNQ